MNQRQMEIDYSGIVPAGPWFDDFKSYCRTDMGMAASRFHVENPHVYEAFKRFAAQALKSGRVHFGIAAIWERIRWEYAIETSDDDFKLNNNYKAFYSRKLMAEDHRFEGFFHTREART